MGTAESQMTSPQGVFESGVTYKERAFALTFLEFSVW